MRPSIRSILLAGASTALIACTGAALAQDDQRAEQSSDNGSVERIVVTAQKRSQSILDVPGSVAALDEKRLDQLGVDDIQDYTDFVPGLDITAPVPGITKTTIRGLSSESVTSSVGVYINETPVTQNELDPDMKLYDVNRIEVLRGPQGTLYGEGSLGGTVRIITNRPDPTQFDASLEGGLSWFENGDGTNYAANGMVNLPVVKDKLAVRGVLGYRSSEPWIDNIGPGDADNDEQSWIGRVAATLFASEDVEATVTYIHQDIDYGSPRNITNPALGDLTRSTRVDESLNDELDVASFTLNWTFDFATLTSDTSYYSRTQHTIGNNNQTGGVRFFYNEIQGAAAGFGPFAQFGSPPGFPFQNVVEAVVDFTGDAEQWTNETRLVSDNPEGSPIDWIIGIFYKDREDTKDTFFSGINLSPEVIDLTPLGLDAGRTLTQFSFEQIAGFGELTFHFTDELDLTVGGRYSSEEVTNQENLTGLFRYNFGSSPPTTTPQQFGPVNETFTSMTPRVLLSYDAGDWLAYGTISRGFRSGGFVGVTPFDPDTVWNYEVGAKGLFWDGRASFAGAAYFIQWDDVQVFDDIPTPPFFAVLNLGEAEIRGIELELFLEPIDNLEIVAGGNLIDTEITEVDPSATAAVGLVQGNEMQKVPEYTFNLQATYTWPIFNGSMNGMISGNVAHQASSFSDFRNLPAEELDAYTTIGARLGIEGEVWSAYIYGKNLTDERIELDISLPPDAPVFGTTVGRPRVIGIEFKATLN